MSVIIRIMWLASGMMSLSKKVLSVIIAETTDQRRRGHCCRSFVAPPLRGSSP
jgi:hypothetical protein